MKNLIVIFLVVISFQSLYAQCRAGFTYEGNNLSIAFTDSSDGDGYPICSYNWDFGDENTSTDINPQHNYDTEGTYTVCLVIITASDSSCSDTVCIDTSCVDIRVPIVDCQLSLSYTKNDVVDNCDGSIDLSVHNVSNQNLTFEWNTGDDTEDLSNLCEGDYAVTVTDGNDCKDSAYISILARDTLFYGRVWAKSNPLPQGMMLLMNQDNEAIDRTPIDDGYYCFKSYTDTGEYTLYAIPYFDVEEEYYPQYFPTYLGDVLNWESTTYVGSESLNSDIHLQYYDDIYHGTGFISGEVRYTEDANFETSIFNTDWFGNFTENCQDGKASNITVLLKNKNNEVVKSCLSNYDGTYYFKHIPLEAYTIYIEKSGKKMLQQNIVLSEQEDSLTHIDFTIGTQTITKIKLKQCSANNISIYPNPFEEKVVIDFQDNNNIDEIQIINVTGNIIFTQKNINGEIAINTSDWNKGLYIVKAYDNKGFIFTKKIIRN